MIVRIVPIIPFVSKNVQTIGTIIWKRYPDDRKRPGRLRRPRPLDRVEFYPDDRDDHVNFEAIIWKRSQTTETIGTIEGYPRSHHFYSSNQVPIFNMLFQLVLTKFFKRELFLCLPKVDQVIKSCKEPIPLTIISLAFKKQLVSML